jgi:hypothetical protein
MTVLSLPDRGRWVWDARDRARAVRVATHREVGLLNLSVWRDETCVGTVKLRPDEVADLVGALTDGLARLAVPTPPAQPSPRISAIEQRLAEVEFRLAVPAWQRAVGDARVAVTGLTGRLLGRRAR